MKLYTFWLICCVGLLYSEGCVHGHKKNRQPQNRNHQPTPLNEQSQHTTDVITPRYVHPTNWFLYKFHNNLLQPVHIIIPPIFLQTACPQGMRGVYSCFIYFYYYPETTTKDNNLSPEITSTTTERIDKFEITTSASEIKEMATEQTSYETRFGEPKVDFNAYYNTTTGVDLNIVKPLRTPTIKIPPADHNAGVTEIINEHNPLWRRPGGSAPVDKNLPRPVPTQKISSPASRPRNTTAFSPPVTSTTTRRSTMRTKSSTRKITQATTLTPLINHLEEDPDSFIFFDQDEAEMTTKKTIINKYKRSRASVTPPTKIPEKPHTNSIETNEDVPIHFNDESITEGTTSVLYEQRNKSDLDQAIKECCNRMSIIGCFQTKGFNIQRDPCEASLRTDWGEKN